MRIIKNIRDTVYGYRAPTFLKLDKRYRRYDIGEYTYGKPKVYAHDSDTKFKIGKFCSIARDVTISLGGEHHTKRVTTYPFEYFFEDVWSHENHAGSKGNITIGNDVWIGHDATILSGVTIGDGAVIGAKTLVAKSIQPYEVVGGNPARKIRLRFSDSEIEKLLKIKWWDWPIEKILQETPYLLSEDISIFIERHFV